MTSETAREQATDEELIARAPEHDGVATQRDLRETERFLWVEIRASEDRTTTKIDRLEDRFDRLDGKVDRMTWAIIVGLGAVVAALIAIAVQL